ncbi:MAG TPA: alpha/beta fold hydrolase [Desulfosalsimonadaceae bacterium]|nr:alpha/beta fold hydrolase [Desulfosalsimonadaceae bacterium]
MSQKNQTTFLDHPDINRYLFYPRADLGTQAPPNGEEAMIPVAETVAVNARFYLSDADQPHILFFHGNGEIASDYDDIGPIYNTYGFNFLVADYRGYGKSDGDPSVSALLQDVHPVFSYVRQWMRRNHRRGPLWIMGRSLGSAAALELASQHPNACHGLIIESGFAHTLDLLNHIGINTRPFAHETDTAIANIDKISLYSGPTLIIHAEHDHIIPLSHGKDLYDKSPASVKNINVIPGADHNTIFLMAGKDYFDIIRAFVDQVSATPRT